MEGIEVTLLTFFSNGVRWPKWIPPRLNKLIAIVEEFMANDFDALNSTMAEQASKRLGTTVDRSDISAIRNLIGEGDRQRLGASLMRLMVDAPSGYPSDPVTPDREQQMQDLALELTTACVRNMSKKYDHAGKLSKEEIKAFNIEVRNRLFMALSPFLH